MLVCLTALADETNVIDAILDSIWQDGTTSISAAEILSVEVDGKRTYFFVLRIDLSNEYTYINVHDSIRNHVKAEFELGGIEFSDDNPPDQNYYVCFDIFTGQFVCTLTSEDDSTYEIVGRQPVDFFWPGVQLLDPKIDGRADNYILYWYAHGHDRAPATIDECKEYYRLVVPKGNQFARDVVYTNNPRSQMPRDRDDVPVINPGTAATDWRYEYQTGKYFTNMDGGKIGYIYLYHDYEYQKVLFLEEKSASEEHGGTAYYELFTGEFILDEKGNVNFAYLDTLQPGAPVSREITFKCYAFSGGVGVPMNRVMRPLKDAKTIGDLRRAYETLPERYWFIPPKEP